MEAVTQTRLLAPPPTAKEQEERTRVGKVREWLSGMGLEPRKLSTVYGGWQAVFEKRDDAYVAAMAAMRMTQTSSSAKWLSATVARAWAHEGEGCTRVTVQWREDW